MDIIKEYEKLRMEFEFKKFLRDNKDYYLVHIVMPEDMQSPEFGFYNPKKDKIVVFKTNPFLKGEEEEVFKEGKTISELEMKKVKINYSEAQEEIKKIFLKEYSMEKSKKKIIILQTLSVPVWNITIICESMNIINIRINAETAEIIRNNKTSLLDMTGVMK